MTEELQESEVIWADSESQSNPPRPNRSSNSSPAAAWRRTREAEGSPSSAPVSIPGSILRSADSDEFEEDCGEMTPPHLIVERRIAGKMAFSVCTGDGRTLKGRDLSRVRNSILRMTGFLET